MYQSSILEEITNEVISGDENALTDNIFYQRHPELVGKGIQKSNPAYKSLAAEWKSIRDTVVRPSLASIAVGFSGSAGAPLTAFRQQVVSLAIAEFKKWSSGPFTESDSRIHPVLEDYWKTGVNRSIRGERTDFWNIPWSAAFISWIMRKARVPGFRYSGAHIEYTISAKNNRFSNTGQVKAYRTTEVLPQPGDIIVQPRNASGATYDNMRSGMATHGDIVVDVQPGRIYVIGGNVSNSVGRRTVKIHSNGLLNSPNHFAVIKID